MNLCVFTGRLTRPPELRTTTTGKTVVSFSIAINEGKDQVTYVNLEAWEKTADFIAEHFTKGDVITVQTQLRNDTWEDKTDGSKRTAAKFVVRQVNFVPGSKSNSSNETDEVVEEEVKPKRATKPKPSKPQPKTEEVEDDDDEIPF